MLSPYSNTDLAILCDYFNVPRPIRLNGNSICRSETGFLLESTYLSEIELANEVARIAMNDHSSMNPEPRHFLTKKQNGSHEALIPRLLFTIGWDGCDQFSGWTESYYMTFFPIFDRYVVTACQSPNEILDMDEVAIGWRSIGVPRLKIAEDIVTDSWRELHRNLTNGAWRCVNKSGLISADDACMWRNRVWQLLLN